MEDDADEDEEGDGKQDDRRKGSKGAGKGKDKGKNKGKNKGTTKGKEAGKSDMHFQSTFIIPQPLPRSLFHVVSAWSVFIRRWFFGRRTCRPVPLTLRGLCPPHLPPKRRLSASPSDAA